MKRIIAAALLAAGAVSAAPSFALAAGGENDVSSTVPAATATQASSAGSSRATSGDTAPTFGEIDVTSSVR
jgi:hypothetical protein